MKMTGPVVLIGAAQQRVGDGRAGRVLVLVFTWRGEIVSLISARKATRAEQRQYAEDQSQ